MNPTFHPFFSKQRELRAEIDRQAKRMIEVEGQLLTTQRALEQAQAALAPLQDANSELGQQNDILHEAHDALALRYTNLLTGYERLEAERDYWKAKAQHKKLPEQINHLAQS